MADTGSSQGSKTPWKDQILYQVERHDGAVEVSRGAEQSIVPHASTAIIWPHSPWCTNVHAFYLAFLKSVPEDVKIYLLPSRTLNPETPEGINYYSMVHWFLGESRLSDIPYSVQEHLDDVMKDSSILDLIDAQDGLVDELKRVVLETAGPKMRDLVDILLGFAGALRVAASNTGPVYILCGPERAPVYQHMIEKIRSRYRKEDYQQLMDAGINPSMVEGLQTLCLKGNHQKKRRETMGFFTAANWRSELTGADSNWRKDPSYSEPIRQDVHNQATFVSEVVGLTFDSEVQRENMEEFRLALKVFLESLFSEIESNKVAATKWILSKPLPLLRFEWPVDQIQTLTRTLVTEKKVTLGATTLEQLMEAKQPMSESELDKMNGGGMRRAINKKLNLLVEAQVVKRLPVDDDRGRSDPIYRYSARARKFMLMITPSGLRKSGRE